MAEIKQIPYGSNGAFINLSNQEILVNRKHNKQIIQIVNETPRFSPQEDTWTWRNLNIDSIEPRVDWTVVGGEVYLNPFGQVTIKGGEIKIYEVENTPCGIPTAIENGHSQMTEVYNRLISNNPDIPEIIDYVSPVRRHMANYDTFTKKHIRKEGARHIAHKNSRDNTYDLLLRVRGKKGFREEGLVNSSVYPIKHEGNKSHLIEMGFADKGGKETEKKYYNPGDLNDLINSKPFVIKPIEDGSKSLGVQIYPYGFDEFINPQKYIGNKIIENLSFVDGILNRGRAKNLKDLIKDIRRAANLVQEFHSPINGEGLPESTGLSNSVFIFRTYYFYNTKTRLFESGGGYTMAGNHNELLMHGTPNKQTLFTYTNPEYPNFYNSKII
jgi:hypothetical protein